MDSSPKLTGGERQVDGPGNPTYNATIPQGLDSTPSVQTIMTLRANFQTSYGWRYLMLTGGFLFAAFFFAYDGFIGYPQKMVYAERYAELGDMETSEKQLAWKQITQENNWPRAVPVKSPEKIAEDIRGQYFYGIICLFVAIPPLILYLRTKGSWIESTPTGLTTSWGQSLDYSKVTKLDKKRWANKGIAVASYAEGNLSRRFVFDDFKYQREPLGQMLRDLEQVLAPEQIVGGPPEAMATDDATGEDSATDSVGEDSSDDGTRGN